MRYWLNILNKEVKLVYFAFALSGLNILLYHFPLIKFASENVHLDAFDGIWTVVSLVLIGIFINAIFIYIIYSIWRPIGKTLMIIFANLNAIACYFINTYGIIVDRTMMGNTFNTNSDEAGSYLSLGMFTYIFVFGILPSVFIYLIKIERQHWKRFLKHFSIALVGLLLFMYANSSKTLWIDKHSKTLGGLAMPWSYVVNTARYYSHESKKNKKEIRLPDAKALDNDKAIVVLVIGESARSMNFSLYGYEKNTNPLLSGTANVKAYQSQSCATYTTAGVKCILEHEESDDLYEILPNYLNRNDVDVIWRTTNWGEPPIKVEKFFNKQQLQNACQGDDCDYDEKLIHGLKAQILASNKDKIFIVLHSSTSHGPSYYSKYPKRFERFTPVCTSVELGDCTQEELINAYDNTIVYTDFLLVEIINTLKSMSDYRSSMIFVSDHGESLGENDLYMHGIPASLAPDEQLDIPFIVWASNGSFTPKHLETAHQQYVFHSVMNFLGLESSFYNPEMSVFEQVK